MDKLGLYDFMSFMLPGGALASLIYLYIAPLFPYIDTTQIGFIILLPALILVFYFLGHLVSKVGFKVEKKFLKTKDYFSSYLNLSSSEVLKKIDSYFLSNYALKLVVPSDSKDAPEINIFNMNVVDVAFDYAFAILESSNKIELARILQSQQRFFRNCIVLFVILFFMQISMTIRYLMLYDCEKWIWPPSLLVLLFAICGIFTSRYLAIERKKLTKEAVAKLLIIHICEPKPI